ncbi:hypothetical protein [Pseudoalteromonas luteoviolacea]|uniref:Uncharacterized protein n=1 Tax=Pseudoalteromonas luteoviolacea NCIMB 1942 TaxID=1365253 RepID=A0A166Z8D4_9GAMM|nr:hypothetical protein [Pseudoalteromonas luteoviolacea]KZN44047.1 hypothetical protein N482_18140 [Pseudoalteromonas luteoviolacea NCIMB 1942]
MSEFQIATDIVLKIAQAIIVIFLLIKFSDHRFSLLFGGKKSLKSLEDHELHSCFISAFCVLVFQFISTEMAKHFLASEMELSLLKKVYYFIHIAVATVFACTLYFLHSLRGCSFSNTAKRCLYLTVVSVLLFMMQLIARGFFNYDGLSPFYSVAALVIHALLVVNVAIYPVKALKKMRNRNQKEA